MPPVTGKASVGGSKENMGGDRENKFAGDVKSSRLSKFNGCVKRISEED